MGGAKNVWRSWRETSDGVKSDQMSFEGTLNTPSLANVHGEGKIQSSVPLIATLGAAKHCNTVFETFILRGKKTKKKYQNTERRNEIMRQK